MMTMHAAKGLEFPVVFVVGAEEGIFPGVRAIGEAEEMEEERRLCYVAMTRAREKLYLTCANQRMLFGRTSANRPSRFVEEILSEHVERSGRTYLSGFGDEEDDWGGMPSRTSGYGGYGGYQRSGYGERPVRSEYDQRPAPSSYGGFTQAMSGSRYGAGRTASGYSARPKADPTLGGIRNTPTSSGASATYQKGDMVKHKAFGKGMVLSVQQMGGDALLEVAFDDKGTKKLMLKAAAPHMEKL